MEQKSPSEPICGALPRGTWTPAYLPVCHKPPGHEGEHQAQDYANDTFGWPGPRWPNTPQSGPSDD